MSYFDHRDIHFADIHSMDIQKVIHRITILNQGLFKFWSSAQGWAPIEAAQLLTKSRLDWQISLSTCLRIWIDSSAIEGHDGLLILAWSNLGSLVEGTMKLFLSVFYLDYKDDVEAIKKFNKLVEPDRLELEPMRQFFKKRIWPKESIWDEWVMHIQQRRNAIHAFRNREIGNFDEFEKDIRIYLAFIRYHNNRLPYPGKEFNPHF